MNKFFKLTAAALLICFALCGCSSKASPKLNEIIDEGAQEVSNSLGENYTVEYEVRSGLHHDGLRVSVFSDDLMIAHYSGRAGKLDVPERIVRLGENCYYLSGDEDEGVFIGGALVPDDKLSEALNEKMTREELAEKLQSCGYPAENMLKCYDGEAA